MARRWKSKLPEAEQLELARIGEDQRAREDRGREIRILEDDEVQAILDDMKAGVHGPVLHKYLQQLLDDRQVRIHREAKLIELLEKLGEELKAERGED